MIYLKFLTVMSILIRIRIWEKTNAIIENNQLIANIKQFPLKQFKNLLTVTNGINHLLGFGIRIFIDFDS